MIYIICLIALHILVIFGYKKIIEHISNKHIEKVRKIGVMNRWIKIFIQKYSSNCIFL